MNSRTLLFAVLLVGLPLRSLSAQPESNTRLLDAWIIGTFREALAGTDTPVRMEAADGSAPAVSWVAALTETGIPLTSALQAPRLRYALTTSHQADHLDRQRFVRHLRATLSWTLHAADGRILSAGERTYAHADTLALARFDQVDGTAPYSRFPSRPASRFSRWMGRWGTPALVTAATGVTVLLLYEMRSR